MKNRFLLLALFLLSGFVAMSQDNYNVEKYLKQGAVPTVGGKVVFSEHLSIAEGYTSEQINVAARSWMEKFLGKEGEKGSRIISDKENEIVAIVQTEIVFQDNAFSLDKAMMSYVITLNSLQNESSIKVDNIRYNYKDGDVVQKILAENYIVDEEAVNKKRTRLLPVTGKFRRKTIDVVEDLLASYKESMKFYTVEGMAELVKNAPQMIASKAGQQPQMPAGQEPLAQSVPIRTAPEQVKASVPMDGYTQISADELQGNFIRMFSGKWTLVASDGQAGMNSGNWGGIGVLYGKPVAICFASPAEGAYAILEKEGRYKLALGGSSVIIECRKLVAQSLMLDAIVDDVEKGKRAMSPMHKMYIGEILNVWVKQ